MVKKKTTDISDFILYLENKYNLLYWKINNIFIWQLIRVDLSLLIQELIYRESYSPKSKKTILKKTRLLFHRIFNNSILRNPFLGNKEYDVIFLESGKKYLLENQYRDLYTFFLKESYQKINKKCLTIETNYLMDGLEKNKNIKHIDFINLSSKIFQFFYIFRIGEKDFSLFKEIEKEIYTEFGINTDIQSFVKSRYKKFKSRSNLFKFLIKKTKCKEIYLVNYVDYPALIHVAKTRNIQVSELQHGLLVKESLIYNFPSAKEDSVEYFPSKFFIWNNFKFNTNKFPLSEKNIISNEYNHLEYMKRKYRNIHKNDKHLLISSQPFFSNKIANFILLNVTTMQDYTFYYKLHPVEFESFEKTDSYEKLSGYKNIIFIKNNVSIYELMAKCKSIIGIYSTSLFEAFYFDCNIFILDTAGSDIASSLLYEKRSHLISLDASLRLIIEKSNI